MSALGDKQRCLPGEKQGSTPGLLLSTLSPGLSMGMSPLCGVHQDLEDSSARRVVSGIQSASASASLSPAPLHGLHSSPRRILLATDLEPSPWSAIIVVHLHGIILQSFSWTSE